MNSLIFSPHCDDAVLSLGGALTQNLISNPKVINVFSQSRWTITGLSDKDMVTKVRKTEDQKVFNLLKITSEYLDLPDASLREEYNASEDKYLDSKLYSKNDPIWIQTSNLIAGLRMNLGKGKQTIYIPLGSGDHIDHKITRDAVLQNDVFEGDDIFLYEDVGYDDTESNNKIILLVKTFPFSLKSKKLEFDNIQTKLDLIKHYTSQIDVNILSQVNRTYEKRERAERVWQWVSKR